MIARTLLSRWCFAAFLFVFALALAPRARAIGPHGDVFVGYSQPTDYDSTGWEASVHFKIRRFVGIEGNVSGFDYGAGATTPVTYAYLVGPRVSVTALRVTVFVHGLVGGAKPSGGTIDGDPEPHGGFLYALGGGLDFPVISRLKWRVSGDYLSAPSVHSSNPNTGQIGRISTGPVFRF